MLRWRLRHELLRGSCLACHLRLCRRVNQCRCLWSRLAWRAAGRRAKVAWRSRFGVKLPLNIAVALQLPPCCIYWPACCCCITIGCARCLACDLCCKVARCRACSQWRRPAGCWCRLCSLLWRLCLLCWRCLLRLRLAAARHRTGVCCCNPVLAAWRLLPASPAVVAGWRRRRCGNASLSAGHLAGRLLPAAVTAASATATTAAAAAGGLWLADRVLAAGGGGRQRHG